MANLVVSQFMTIDGVVEDPGGSEDMDRGGWAFQFDRGDEGNEFKMDEVMSAGSLLLGRVTYGGFAEAWPSREGDFADKFNTMPKYVASTTLRDPEWANSTVLSEDIPGEVAKLKDSEDDDILVNGSVTLISTLVEHGLVDEYRLMVFPLVLGKGKRLFGDPGKSVPLRLTASQEVGPDGVVILTYAPA